MGSRQPDLKAEILDRVVAGLDPALDDDERTRLDSYIRQFYRAVAVEDLAEREPGHLLGAALRHLDFAARRKPGTPNLRVYNPTPKRDGWESTHTIVEMVNDDMPFLVDSLGMVLNRHGLMVHITIHPIFRVRRDANGRLLEVLTPSEASDDAVSESFMHIEIDRQTDAATLKGIETDIRSVLQDVRVAVEDWRAMRDMCNRIRAGLDEAPPPLHSAEVAEGKRFLEWLENDHFTFLGYREYALEETSNGVVLNLVPGTGMGILREDDERKASSPQRLNKEIQSRAYKPELLIITKANSISTVHRPGYLDYIAIKQFDADGNVTGEKRFLGLFTSAAYNKSPRDIPLLKQKVQQVMSKSGLPANSHGGKALMHILETYPRDELFQSTVDELYGISIGILQLQERQRVRLFMRRDSFGRFWSCLVFVPRDRYNTQIRERIQKILMDALKGESIESNPKLSESMLARLHVIVRIRPGRRVKFDAKEIERRLADAVRSWQDELRDALVVKFGEERGLQLYNDYGRRFPPAYIDDVTAKAAAFDVERIGMLFDGVDLPLSLYKPTREDEDILRFKIFKLGDPIPLSEALPMLEHMGLRVVSERPYTLNIQDRQLWIQDFDMSYTGQKSLEEVRDNFQDAFYRTWRGDAENDGFNRLVLAAGLSWRQCSILRAYCKYLLQTGLPFSQAYMEQTLSANPGLATMLVELFESRFDPGVKRETRDKAAAKAIRDIESALESVASLDEDRILRSFYTVVMATLRTNFFQPGEDGQPKTYVSFKFDPSRIPELPLPKPAYEIFVYSPRVEGVHLRGGKVARGGLRWSDRREDFRTEILGLMKAQTVKNTLIVPVGAKGGFVVKRPPAGGDREAMTEEVIACYSTFIRGLLDITDNLSGTRVVPPKKVIRHDDDDPYLVVAADKGTATFSDIANAISVEYGFWLGDAFASGGSNGYDHKKMGITARGAWESVKRHFRELGLDTQNEDFTVVGVGDMAGDVFGNGMLLSRHIKLKAAFNHMHIFLDPDPDPEASFAERERLFKLPRSSWDDYDKSLISEGGGVYPRSAKSIRLSKPVQEWLGIESNSLTPQQLIHALLKAPVDLLWNGGIGTYVKASTESHSDAGDRANDGLRVDGGELRCRVVGEGGNLGMTQLGRIEYALAGGRVNTDFIDNSAGVDCSDHEVNIKILFNAAREAGRLSEKRRNRLLADMTEEVSRLVLRNNYIQTQAISIVEDQAKDRIEEHAYLIRSLERAGRLNRALEYLPADDEIAQRRTDKRGLTRPELSVLLAYSKITIYDALLDSDVPEDPYLANELESYFPEPVRKPFAKQMQKHRLRREIITTHITNSMVNRMGPTFSHRMQEESGKDAADVARAYTIAREAYDMRSLWKAIEDLDNIVPSGVQTAAMVQTQRLIKHTTHWLLAREDRPDIAKLVERYGPHVQELAEAFPDILNEHGKEWFEGRVEQYIGVGVPQPVASRVAALGVMYAALDLSEVAIDARIPITDAASVYYRLGTELGISWLRDRIEALPVDGHWHAIARATLRDDLYAQQCALTTQVLQSGARRRTPMERLESWLGHNEQAVQHTLRTVNEMRNADAGDFATLSVALAEVRKLAELRARAAGESKG